MRTLEELNAVQASVGRPLLTRMEYDALVEWAIHRVKPEPWEGE
jgi:hypothetical protein